MIGSRLHGSWALAGVVAAVAVGYALPAQAAQVCSSGPFVQGVDVSGGEGSLDWASAAGAGIKFAFMKATQGNYFTDSEFSNNWSGTKANGIVRGAYHFFDGTISGVTQANYFLGVVGTIAPTDLPPVLDIECPDGTPGDDCLGNGSSGAASAADLTQGMNDFLTTVQAATGRTPIVYSYGSWFADNGVDTTGLTNYPLWIAYPTTTSCFDVPSPWTTAAIWQYSFTGDVPGIGSGGDLDQFLGTMAQFTAVLGTVPPPSDGGTPTTPFAAPSQPNGNDALSIVSWADGHMDLFATESGGVAAHMSTTTTGDAWSSPAMLGGTADCGVASVMWAPGSGHLAEVFDGLGNGTTESLEWESSAYTSFASFGGSGLSHLSTLAYGDDHIEVFALGTDGTIWHNVSTQSSWGGWASMGGGDAGAFTTGAGPILWTDGHAEIFVTDAQGTPWHNYTNTASPPVWAGWSALTGGPLASRPVPVRWADGHVEVFARGTNGQLYTSDYTNNTWPAFAALNPTQVIQGEPSVLVYPSYGPEIFARDMSGNLIHMWNSTGTWSAWANDFNQVLASDPLAWLRPDGVAEVFGVDGSGNVVKSLHSGASWSAWSTLGSGFEACVGGVMPDSGTLPPPADGGGTGVDSGTAPEDGGVADGGTGVGPDGGGQPTEPGKQQGAASKGCSCRGAAGANGGDAGGAAVGLLLLGAVVTRRRAKG